MVSRPGCEARRSLPCWLQEMPSRWIRDADDPHKTPAREPSYRRRASGITAQEMPGSLFTRTEYGIVNDMGGQGAVCAVDEEPVLPDHAASLMLPVFNGARRELFFNQMLEIVFDRHTSRLSVRSQSGFNFRFEVQGYGHCIHCLFSLAWYSPSRVSAVADCGSAQVGVSPASVRRPGG